MQIDREQENTQTKCVSCNLDYSNKIINQLDIQIPQQKAEIKNQKNRKDISYHKNKK
jgi:hypothetical protein